MSQSRKENIHFKTVSLFSNIAKSLAPPPKLLVSDWADENRILSQGSSSEPGRWNTSRAEYQREIMNAVNSPEVQDIAIMSSSQVGKTEIELNIVGYFMDYEPASIMFVQPTILMAENFSKKRLAKMISETQVLNKKINVNRMKDSDNTILSKDFPGGYIVISGANSPASLASTPIRIVLCDEIDRYPVSAGEEGDPLKLAEKRTTAFWNRKKIKVSTPTTEAHSKIKREFLRGTQEEWSVRCPCCGTWQAYEFKRLHFDEMKMECIHCKEKLNEQEWKEQEHKWIAKEPDRVRYRSFHLNEMCSPWKHWEDIVEDFKAANEEYKRTGSTKSLIVFKNTSLGETWEERGDGADDEELLNRREVYEADIPDGVLLLTAGVDVQDDRLEYEIVGWGKEYESWGLWKKEIRSDPSKDAAWERLVDDMETTFYFKNGTGLQIAGICVDTGGHHTNKVYKFIKKMSKSKNRFFGIKGYANVPGIPLIYKKTKVEIKNDKGKVIDGTSIYILGVDSGKEDIISRLNIKEPGEGYCHFPSNIDRGYNQTYMQGLTAEEKATVLDKRGNMKVKWVKKTGVRNEPLDLRNYAYAAVELLSPNWTTLEEKISRGINYMAPEQNSKKRRKRKPGVVNRGVVV